MNTVAIVLARMSSARFPGKILRPLLGKPLIRHVLDRAAAATRVDTIVVATSTEALDDELVQVVEDAGFPCYRGDLFNVLDRFHGAAAEHNAETIVRITGDCPLLDPELLDAMLAEFEKGTFDFLTNASPPTYPDGYDLEIMNRATLDAARKGAHTPHQKEHVTPYILEHQEQFRVGNHLNPAGDMSDWLWSVDRPEHLEMVEALLSEASGVMPGLADIAAVAQRQPNLAAIPGRRRNEGAILTLHRDLEQRTPDAVIDPSYALSESEAEVLTRRTAALIPAGTQTLSKGTDQFCQGFGPTHLVRGQGCRVWDTSGKRYLDYPMGLGPITLGHGHPAVVEAVTRALREGNALSLCHPLEAELAQRIVDLVPCAEQVRFGKNGSDATTACIRAARAYTGRDLIARHGYHGWQDWSIDRDYGIRSKGVPEAVMAMTRSFPYNDLPALDALLESGSFAAIIMEPVNLHLPEDGFLQGVRELADSHGAVLIFDEIITGFRYHLGGAQAYFGVEPDLCAMGKGVANGVPLSIVCGKQKYMAPFEEVFFSFTFGGETMGLAAALATLDVMEQEDYPAHCWAYGSRLQKTYDRLAKDYGFSDCTHAAGLAPWTVILFEDAYGWRGMQLKTLFQQEMLRRGVLFSGSQFISLAHDDAALEETEAAYRGAFQVLRAAIDNKAVDEMTLGQENRVVFRRG